MFFLDYCMDNNAFLGELVERIRKENGGKKVVVNVNLDIENFGLRIIDHNSGDKQTIV